MKYFRFLRFAAWVPLLVACSTDPAGDVPSAPDPVPAETNHAVPVEAALGELHAVLAGIDGPATRVGGGRRVGDVVTVKADGCFPPRVRPKRPMWKTWCISPTSKTARVMPSWVPTTAWLR